MKLLSSLKRVFRLRSLEHADHSVAGSRPVGTLDAEAEAGSHEMNPSQPAGPGYPPGYVKDYDEGRPRK